MHDLLHVLHSDGADRLKLSVGRPPVIVIDREEQSLDLPVLTEEDAERLLQTLTDSRQRRDLRERGAIEFVYRFRDCASFVVSASIRDEVVSLEVH